MHSHDQNREWKTQLLVRHVFFTIIMIKSLKYLIFINHSHRFSRYSVNFDVSKDFNLDNSLYIIRGARNASEQKVFH